MSYESFDSDLVELFEYKVADMLAGKMPRGGKVALRDLRDYLLGAPLDSVAMRRMRQADRQWREFQKTGKVSQPAPTASTSSPTGTPTAAPQADFDPLSLLGNMSDLNFASLPVPATTKQQSIPADASLSTDPELSNPGPSGPQHADSGHADLKPTDSGRNEWDVLQQLRGALFYYELHHRAQQQAAQWVSSKQFATLRVALALGQALQKVFPNPALPKLELSYTDLVQPAQAAEVLSTVTQHLAYPLETLPLNFQRIRSVLRELLGNNFPAKLLDIKPLKEEERDQEQLAHTLHKLLAYAQPGEGVVARANQQPTLLNAVQQLMTFLETVVPHSMGGHGAELALLGGLLYARGQSVRLNVPDEQSLSLAIYLAGGDQTQWRGNTLRWRRLGDGWEIVLSDPQAGDDFVRLSAAHPLAESHLNGEKIYLALLGDDLALERRPSKHSDLAAQVLEARLSAALLEPEQDYVNLRLARAAAMRLRGAEINADKVSPESAAVYSSAPAATLLAFARQGAQTLLRAAPLAAPEQLTQAFAHAMIATQAPPETAQGLIDLLLTPLQQLNLPVLSDYSAPMVTDNLSHAVLLLRGEPLTVRVMNQPLTLRNDYKGNLSAIVPGVPTALVGDMLALPVPRGAVIMVRQGERVAVGFQPKLPHPETPDAP